MDTLQKQIAQEGFAVTEPIFEPSEIHTLLEQIAELDTDKSTFRKTNDLFAIRQFFKEAPETLATVFNEKLKTLVTQTFGKDFFIVKSIYFDKPEQSNWFVAYHQDLTISVDRKVEEKGFGPWTVKQNQFAVQPPLTILENNFTIRIHLDDTHEQNGALKVIPGSHLKGIYRPDTIDWTQETEAVCSVSAGAVMFMKPLLLHASSRTTNQQRRRVIHIECSNTPLPESMQWSEYLDPF
ncbi:phytanoyl-CoA dioxygenase family protein [Siphonobacter sp. SORGH_AS_0500]|uniref:phytanoyl-CoA dioxygenase family protein n=1 Tax=Siphonobacter sp. SORGH_AS_0500 TaxID=1864824 RepID=UPI002861FE49|nr:phytanoyl-CoA dioxygenase family protein [Siphonobacter sp. SORGH_AS_0500]MDR6193477.1 ectoine hydroxylase-related dioxygenase (phytanoyl-CoA dioxygenase family) [Siphonobacter sp. SORGH_AS_0500]